MKLPMDEILFSVEDGIATIRLNRPKVFNSFNRDMALSMQEKLDQCERDPEIRCVVIVGEGKAFCAGQDLAEAIDPEGPELSKIVSEHYNPIILKLRKVKKPIVAAVNGVAAGAGANIALACDIVVAAESASFIQAFSKIGLIPDSGGTYTLPRIIGFQKASALMMLGDKVQAEEAERLGMIYRWYPDDVFATEVQKLAQKLAQMPTYGLGLTKCALNRTYGNTLEKQLALEDELQTRAGLSHDYEEGVNAFLEKRPPKFKGE
jgi:2-(1,2-epoxy-1,2-dihydrophenyl)acetyl-CoA isomerase